MARPDPDTAHRHAATEPVLVADAIEVRASWGHVFGPTSLTVRPGGVSVLVGSGGRGRTALLLTLAGRMRPTKGKLTSFGRTNAARYLFARAAIADIDEIDGIEQAIRVRDVLTETLRWMSPWYKWVPQSTTDDLERICRPVFGPHAIPPLDAFVEELPEFSATLFRIAVANARRPPILVVGGVDRLNRVDSSHKLMQRLVDLGRSQTIITADVNGGFPDLPLRDVIQVHHLTDNEFVGLEPADRN
ncbi:ATP-binding cassette domain-containing protein [Gordonia sp. DT30]|uniref:ATP-binding cassette domain-containing protein n=1 Tax=unclassified Gordonia (in: high G+C Gram-positive bacteria) TaxID=2657482 RepID=UPI003CEB07D1